MLNVLRGKSGQLDEAVVHMYRLNVVHLLIKSVNSHYCFGLIELLTFYQKETNAKLQSAS